MTLEITIKTSEIIKEAVYIIYEPAPYTRQSFSRPEFFWITFHFTSSVCLCVGYKMKTCTQISDSGFRGEINVVNPGDSRRRELSKNGQSIKRRLSH